MASVDRRCVPLKEAIARIGDGTKIHTIMQAGEAPILIGAYHSRRMLIAAMKKFGVEDSGSEAAAMGHTLVIPNYPIGDGRTDALFIEAKPTDDSDRA